MVDVKNRRLLQKDWDKVEKWVKDVHQTRKTSKFRQDHERVWREVDRQIAMKPMKKILANGREAPRSWESAIELGELAEASEIITDDVMRIQFPADKSWFQPHVELDWPLDPKTGRKKTDDQKQEIADGLLRALMGQQHKDFGFKPRYQLSVKEALHHGSFVAEVRFEKNMLVKDGDKIRTVGSPVWHPYSMWNAYPDPSPSVIGGGLFYTGSMVLVEFMPLYRLKQMKTEGWMPERIALVKKQTNKNMDDDTEDVELVKFKGDLVIERGDGDIFLPNSEVILANGKIVYYAPNPLPYPNVIFGGYERQDVRDPYYTSPIIKQSPTHKMTSIMANEFIDGVKLWVKPPIEYDSNDPEYAANDGPVLAPGAKTATRSMGKGFTQLKVGDPKAALDALVLGKQEMKEGLGVSSNRAGVRDQDRETATAATLANQGAEVRTMGFINNLESLGLLQFLYMQHELNRMEMTEYTFYNDEMHTPDFIRATKKDIQANAHFDVVGSRGILGEQQRQKRIMETTAFFASSPLFAPRLRVTDIMMEGYRDAGKKDPESFVKVEEGLDPQIQAQFQQLQQLVQQLAQENKDLKSKHQEKVAQIQADMAKFQTQLMNDKQEFAKEFALKVAEFKLEVQQAHHEASQERLQSNVNINAGDEIGKVAKNLQELANNQSQALLTVAEKISNIGDMQQSADKMLEAAEKVTKAMTAEKPRRKLKIVRTREGYEAE